MITIEGLLLYVDVDETLITYTLNPNKSIIEIHHPYHNVNQQINVMESTVKYMKNWQARGGKVIVWSAQGGLWAATVVKRLELESIVYACVSKPILHIDDKEEVLYHRVFFPAEHQWGQ